MLLDLNRYSPAVFRKEASKLGALAVPMLLAQIAQVGLGFVDTVMAGGAGKTDLAAVALGSSAFVTVYITFLGIMTALNPMIAQEHGAGEVEKVAELGRQGILYGLMLGIIGMILLWLMIQPFNSFLDLDAEVKRQFALYVSLIALSMPAAMIHRALHAFASSLGKPKPIMWMSWISLFLNIPLNHIFVYGDLGMPALGGAGCGLASTLVFWFNAAALWAYIAKQKYFQRFGLFARFSKPSAKIFRQITKLGVPIGLSFFLEVSLFTVMMMLIAQLPGNAEDHVAAQQVVNSITSLIYVIPQGIGAAVTVRVGYAIGADRYFQARYASGVALACGSTLAIVTAVLTLLFRYMRPLIEGGHTFIAMPPLYRIKWTNAEHEFAYSDKERDELLAAGTAANRRLPKEGGIQRYKGLGEMNDHELWETTMDPEHRILKQVTLDEAADADETFTILMGDDVDRRRTFIQRNATDVRFLDI